MKSIRILLAEDDAPVREMLTKILTRRGWQVRTAANGEEALRLWREGEFDLILTDMRMPNKTGLEVTRTIRAEEKSGPRIPIIAITAHLQTESRREYFKEGVNEYLKKPIRISTLYALVERYIH